MQQHYEERIPQIKQQRPRRRANQKLLVLLMLFFLAILIVLFVRSPYSKVSEIKVSGNELYTAEQIKAASGLSIGMQFLNVWQSSVQESEKQLAGVKEVTISRQFPGVIELQVKEYARVAFFLTPDSKQSLLLENGLLLDEPRPGERIVDRPLVRSWPAKELLAPLAKALAQLPQPTLSMISDITLTPTAFDKQRITLFMRDGNEVRSVIHLLSSKLPWYPSIVKELPKDEKGVVFMLESTWFSKYEAAPPVEEDKAAGTQQDGQAPVQTGQSSGQAGEGQTGQSTDATSSGKQNQEQTDQPLQPAVTNEQPSFE
ncbi:MAG: cell division protein FtsQ/DivIB [Clostridia bacterium]